MKQNFTTFTIITLLLLPVLLFGQSPEKTLVKSFSLEGANVVLLDLFDKVEVRKWQGDFVRVHMTIGLPTCSEPVLKSLVKAGRYVLDSHFEKDRLVIDAPGLAKEIKMGGNEIKESISYTVFVPENVFVLFDVGTLSAKFDVALKN